MHSLSTVAYYDEKSRRVRQIEAKKLADRIGQMHELLDQCANRLSVNNYKLQEIQVTLSVEGGYWVIRASGSVKLTYKPS